jgi:hypothetical protein
MRPLTRFAGNSISGSIILFCSFCNPCWFGALRPFLELELMRLLIFFLALTIGSAAQGATISVTPTPNGGPALVAIDGDLEANDGDQFRSKTRFLSKALVSFRSDGGSIVAAIQIGESIRSKGFATLVAGNLRCASACAIAWLGGTPRLMSAEARIGFHAAYSSKTGQETGIGNALVGAYLSRIGLSYSAVVYISQAAPNSMTWLSIADAEKLGIDIQAIEQDPIQRECSNRANALGLHGSERWEFRAECKKRGGGLH